MLENEGHNTEKIELRIIGEVFLLIKKYKEWFLKECFRACNEFGKTKSTIQHQKTHHLQQNKSKMKLPSTAWWEFLLKPDLI